MHERQLDPVIAIHEAGHAIARFLTVGDLGGYSEDAAIAYIEVHSDPAQAQSRDSFDKKATLHSQAITYGPRFPKQVSDAVLRLNSATDVTLDELTAIFAKARDDGVHIDKWLRAKLFEIVSGPMAEAIFSQQISGKYGIATRPKKICAPQSRTACLLASIPMKFSHGLMRQLNGR